MIGQPRRIWRMQRSSCRSTWSERTSRWTCSSISNRRCRISTGNEFQLTLLSSLFSFVLQVTVLSMNSQQVYLCTAISCTFNTYKSVLQVYCTFCYTVVYPYFVWIKYIRKTVLLECLTKIQVPIDEYLQVLCESRRKVLLDHVHEGYERELWEYQENAI